MKITKKNYQQLIRGTSIYSTGGGVPLQDQEKTLGSMKKLSVNVKEIEAFPANGFLMTAAEVGPSSAPEVDKKLIVKKMFTLLQKNTNYPIVGIYPSELGQESVVLQTAFFTGLPIGNFDPTGMRATPYTDINIFHVKKIPLIYSPLVVANDLKELFLIEAKFDYKRVETMLRNMTAFSKDEIIFYIGGLVRIKDILRLGKFEPTYTKALQAGKQKTMKDLLLKIHPKDSISGYVKKIQKIKKQGFLAQKITIYVKEGKCYVLTILNEALFLQDENNHIIAEIPERILLIDSENLVGIPSGNIAIGMHITICILPIPNGWDNKEGRKVFGRERFKFLLK